MALGKGQSNWNLTSGNVLQMGVYGTKRKGTVYASGTPRVSKSWANFGSSDSGGHQLTAKVATQS